MSTQLIVNNTPFDYPTKGDEPGWGGPSTDWAVEVTEVLANVQGPDDILETAFNIANNQTTPADITGLIFNTGSARSATVEYSVYRISDSNPTGKAETGEMHLIFDGAAGWDFAIGGVVGNSEVVFSILSTGQIQYTSSDIGSLGYNGVMKFRAKALQQ